MDNNRTTKNDFNINLRAFRLLHSFSPKTFPLMILKNIFNSLSPYINLYMSAEILNEIAGNRSIDRLIFLVAVTLISNLAVSVISGILSKEYSKADVIMWQNQDYVFNNKTLSLDYADMENPKISQLRWQISDSSCANGYGSWYFVHTLDSIVNGIVELIFSMILFIELFVVISRHGFSLPALIFSIAIIGTIVLSIVYKFCSKKILSTKEYDFSEMCSYARRIHGAIDYDGLGKDVRLYRLDKFILKLKRHLIEKNREHFFHNNMLSFLLDIPEVLFGRILQIISYLFVVLYAVNGMIEIGSILKYTGILRRLIDAIYSIWDYSARLKYNSQFLYPYMEYLDISSKMRNGTEKPDFYKDNYVFELKNVSFKYPASDTYALKNVSMTITSGERLAVVGMNGSGKTTFIKLLCRLYDPTEGEILLNGKNIKEYDYNEYMKIFSVVFQDFKLFSFSLGENIAAGNQYNQTTLTSETVENCLDKVGFTERFNKMENGLDTYLYRDFDEKGVEISGGEAQKIALARALYKDAPCIILDEPTAALDPIAEFEIYSKFNEIVGDKTAIYISHRLSSCRFCHDIAVFHEGEMIQSGSHESLLADIKGKYYELWTAQAQYYTETA